MAKTDGRGRHKAIKLAKHLALGNSITDMNEMRHRLLIASIMALSQLTLLPLPSESKPASIERYEFKSQAIDACKKWQKGGVKFYYYTNEWVEDNNRICVDGQEEYQSSEIVGMEAPAIEPKNYDEIPEMVMEIIKFFDYQYDDESAL